MDCLSKAGANEGACRQMQGEIIAYCAGRLTTQQKAAFSQHLDSCATCRAAADAQAQVWSALDAWITPPLAADFDARLYAKIDAYERQSWGRRMFENLSGTWSFKPAMPIAVACSFLVAAFLFDSPAPKHSSRASVQQELETKIDVQQVERALDDLDMLNQLGAGSTQAASKPLRARAL